MIHSRREWRLWKYNTLLWCCINTKETLFSEVSSTRMYFKISQKLPQGSQTLSKKIWPSCFLKIWPQLPLWSKWKFGFSFLLKMWLCGISYMMYTSYTIFSGHPFLFNLMPKYPLNNIDGHKQFNKKYNNSDIHKGASPNCPLKLQLLFVGDFIWPSRERKINWKEIHSLKGEENLSVKVLIFSPQGDIPDYWGLDWLNQKLAWQSVTSL